MGELEFYSNLISLLWFSSLLLLLSVLFLVIFSLLAGMKALLVGRHGQWHEREEPVIRRPQTFRRGML